MRPFGEAQSKAMRAYAQSDNIIPLWRFVILTWYQSVPVVQRGVLFLRAPIGVNLTLVNLVDHHE